MVSPSKGEVREFNAELADFTDSWLGRTEVDELQTVCSIFENPEFEEALKLYKAEGHDLGVGVFASMSEDELHQYLGYRNGLPLGFRCYTHAEHEKIPYQLDADTPFDGCDKVVLSWHQLVFVAAVFTHMSNSKQAALEGILHYSSSSQYLAQILFSRGGCPVALSIQLYLACVSGLCNLFMSAFV